MSTSSRPSPPSTRPWSRSSSAWPATSCALVGTSTPEEYRRHVETDAGLARRFTPVEIEEPDEAAAFLLLRSVAAGLGKHHGLAYGDDAIAATVSWSIRYLPGRALPDKAISILDLAGARARRKVPRR